MLREGGFKNVNGWLALEHCCVDPVPDRICQHVGAWRCFVSSHWGIVGMMNGELNVLDNFDCMVVTDMILFR